MEIETGCGIRRPGRRADQTEPVRPGTFEIIPRGSVHVVGSLYNESQRAPWRLDTKDREQRQTETAFLKPVPAVLTAWTTDRASYTRHKYIHIYT